MMLTKALIITIYTLLILALDATFQRHYECAVYEYKTDYLTGITTRL